LFVLFCDYTLTLPYCGGSSIPLEPKKGLLLYIYICILSSWRIPIFDDALVKLLSSTIFFCPLLNMWWPILHQSTNLFDMILLILFASSNNYMWTSNAYCCESDFQKCKCVFSLLIQTCKVWNCDDCLPLLL